MAVTTPTSHSAGLLFHAPDRISSFDQNPDSGGTAEMVSHPMMKQADVIGQVLAERAHASHVLLVVEPVDHRAGREEQQRLEEGVGDHVEHRGHVAPASRRPGTCTRAG